jgi:hypothetical protein
MEALSRVGWLVQAVLLRRGVYDDITIVVVDLHPRSLDLLASPTSPAASAKSWWDGHGWLVGLRSSLAFRIRGWWEGGGGASTSGRDDAAEQRDEDRAGWDSTAHDVVPPLVEVSHTDPARSLLHEVRPPRKQVDAVE